MDWDSVRFFLALARAGSVRGAAHELGVDNSTVTRRLSSLEEALGVRLFERAGPRYVCSERGREVRAIAERIDGEMKLFERVAGAARQQCVRVSCPTLLAPLVARSVGEFSELRPDVLIELESSDRRVDVAARQADVVVRIEMDPAPELVGRRVGRLSVELVASTSYLEKFPHAPSDQRHAWVAWDDPYADKPPMRWAAREFPNQRVVTRGTSGESVFQAIHAGLGLGLLPGLVARAAGFVSLQVLPAETFPSVWVLSAEDSHESEAVRAVRNHLFALGAALEQAA